MVDDVAPPLPVKQRSKSVLSEQNSIPHDGGTFRTVPSPQRHTVGYDTVSSSSRHAVNLPSAEFMASLDVVLAELNEASAPPKPPRSTRLSSYDNVMPSGGSAAISGKHFNFPSPTVTPNSSTTTCPGSSDEPSSNSFVSPSSDESMAECFTSSSREVSRANNNSSMSQTSYRVTSMTAGCLPSQPATTVAPPLPMKLKHSQSSKHFAGDTARNFL